MTDLDDAYRKAREQEDYYDALFERGARRTMLVLSGLMLLVPHLDNFLDTCFVNGILTGVIASWLGALICLLRGR